MTFEELKEKAAELSVDERLELMSAITQSLKDTSHESDSQTRVWQFLESRPDSWRQQLFIKGRKLRAFNVWSDIIANDMTPEESAQDWGLPVAAVQEAIKYCEANQDLLRAEAEVERKSLSQQGVSLEPASIS